MGVLKKLVGQTAIYGISSILGRLLNLGLTPLYTRVFLPGVYGVLTYLYSWVALINVALTFGMETTFFRFSQDDKDPQEVYNQAFLWVLVLDLLFLLIAGAGYQVIAGWIGYSEYAPLVLMTVGIIFLDTLAALPMARLRYNEKAKRFAFINVINIVLTVALNFLLILLVGKDISYVFVANLIASTLRMVMAMWGNLPTTLRPDKEQLREMVHYGYYIVIAGLAGMMTQTIDRILIPALWKDGTVFREIARTGEEMVGLYGANYKLVMLIGLATQAFRYAVEPFFFKESGQKDSPETFARVFHYFMLASLGGFLLLASFAKEIVSLNVNVFGLFHFTFIDEKYWSALDIVPILLLAYVLNGAYLNLSIWFKITKQVRYAILFSGVGAVLVIGINVLTIPAFGYMGSAWATLIGYAVMCTMVYVIGQRYYPIPYRIGRLLLYGLLFVLAYFLNAQIGPTDGFFLAFFWKAGVCLAVFGAVYVGEIYLPVFGSKAKTYF